MCRLRQSKQLAQGQLAQSRGTTACLNGGRKDLDQYVGRLCRMIQLVDQRQRSLGYSVTCDTAGNIDPRRRELAN